MKVLVIGGLHGNEPLGLEVYDRLIKNPIPGVTALLGNPTARQQNVRFVERDLNRVFPGRADGKLEERRALELINQCTGYDVVLDFHNTNCPDNDCGFVGGTNYSRLLTVASFLGLDKVIVADYDCINKFVPGCLSVEISLSSGQCSATVWISRIAALATQHDVLSSKQPSLYRFARRVSRSEQDMHRFRNWKAFRSTPKGDLAKLGLAGEYYPIFIDDAYTPDNYAGLIEPFPRPACREYVF